MSTDLVCPIIFLNSSFEIFFIETVVTFFMLIVHFTTIITVTNADREAGPKVFKSPAENYNIIYEILCGTIGAFRFCVSIPV
jgi:hypothetical protein